MIPYLDFNGGASTPGAIATVAGWGAKFEGGETTDEQREVDIPLISIRVNCDFFAERAAEWEPFLAELVKWDAERMEREAKRKAELEKG
mgnify:CR=1 FL=1